MSGSDRQSGPTASQPHIDATLYKVLFEFEQRMTSQFEKARIQNKEDTQLIVEVAVSRGVQPVMAEIAVIKQQLQEGNRRFDDQSSRITKAKDLALQAASDALTAKTEAAMKLQTVLDDDDEEKGKPKGGWISADKLPALIIAIGTLVSILMSSIAMMRNPQQAPTQIPTPPAVAAPVAP